MNEDAQVVGEEEEEEKQLIHLVPVASVVYLDWDPNGHPQADRCESLVISKVQIIIFIISRVYSA